MKLTCELDTNDLRGLELPRDASHDIDSIRSTDTDGDHSETTSIGGVRVSTKNMSVR